jgi:hypothetical protein
MARYTITTRDAAFTEAWGGDTITAEGNADMLRVVDAPNASLIGEPIEGISADGEEIEEQLAAMYVADVEIMPIGSGEKSLLLIQMQGAVPRAAIGYVATLGGHPSLRVEADCLEQLERHCPELVARYRAAD